MDRRYFLRAVSAVVAMMLAKVGIAGAAANVSEKETIEIVDSDEHQYWCTGRDCSHCTWSGNRDVRPNLDYHYDNGWVCRVIDERYEEELKATCVHSTMDMPKAWIIHRSDGQVTLMLHDRRPVWITISKDDEVSRFAAGGTEESPPIDQYISLVKAA